MNTLPAFLYDWTIYLEVFEWAIRLVMLVYIPQKRSAAAARTWLLLVFFQPIVGLIFYALFGRIYYPKSRSKKLAYVTLGIEQVRSRLPRTHEITPVFDTTTTEIAGLAERLGSFVPMSGNTIQLLDDYNNTLGCIMKDIDAATHHVNVLMYIYTDDDTGRKMTNSLIAAARRGVQCRVLLDALGARSGLRAFRKEMETADIEVVEVLPMGSLRGVLKGKSARFDLRNHRKIIVIDGRIGYIGSQNIVNRESTPGLPNEELVVRTTGPIVSELQAVFLADHFVETSRASFSQEYFPESEASGQDIAQVLPSGPGYGTQNAQMVLISLIHNAQKRIVITTPYFVPDESFLQALHVACYRGVEIHLVLLNRLDQRFTQAAQESYFGVLLDYGINIHLYHPAFLHAKHVTIDDNIAIIGSTNMDIRSFALNAEIALILYDKELVAKVNAIQERYFSHSHLVDRQQWQRRPLHKKTWQNLARLADSLL